MPAARVRRRSARCWAGEFVWLALMLALAIAIAHWGVAIVRIGSPAMLPDLSPGDYLLVEKWPFAAGRRRPARGDALVARVGRGVAVGRVIGLPGDRIARSDGTLILNDRAVPRWRVADRLFVPPEGTACRAAVPQRGGGLLCRAIRYREMPPDGPAYDVFGADAPDHADFPPILVPHGALLLLGNGRPAPLMITAGAVIGRPAMILFSIDPAVRLARPRGWWRALHWDRSGATPWGWAVAADDKRLSPARIGA